MFNHKPHKMLVETNHPSNKINIRSGHTYKLNKLLLLHRGDWEYLSPFGKTIITFFKNSSFFLYLIAYTMLPISTLSLFIKYLFHFRKKIFQSSTNFIERYYFRRVDP